ncbi:SRPBCC family protein [Pseudonocardia nigra]|uniref:SRPBCC family protein n=1 Tax=Pseudonocardia nigra TaxID=1921578 RepID=UPI001C5F919B|nr:SRPBCC family protein [Pseudonocardia nigra]
MSTPRRVSESVVVSASPDAVFALLADPRRHAEFDGSGTVRTAVSGPDRLALGATFGMDMRWGLPYRIRNTVVEFEENRRIGWRHFGRHIWRYELEPIPGGTRVTETFDYGPSPAAGLLETLKAPQRNLRSIHATLARLGTIFGTPAAQS